MSLNGKRIFIAGATGLAGSAILKRLLEFFPSVTVRAACNQTVPFLHDERIEYVRADLTLPEECRRVIVGCDYAVMAAARTSGAGVLTSQPWQQVNANLFMNATLLQVLAESSLKRLVLVGSASLYQDFDGFIREDQLDLNQDPPEAYLGIGWVTRYIEKLCAFWNRQAGIDIVILRTANIFGPFSRFNPQSSNFIPALIRKAVDGMDPFEVWGESAVTRDVIYADDFASAVVKSLAREDIRFDVFNIGSGVMTTVGEVVGWALKYSGHAPSRIVYNEDRPSTVRFRALDCSKAHGLLGWSPEVSVEQGIRNTVTWWEKNKDWWAK